MYELEQELGRLRRESEALSRHAERWLAWLEALAEGGMMRRRALLGELELHHQRGQLAAGLISEAP